MEAKQNNLAKMHIKSLKFTYCFNVFSELGRAGSTFKIDIRMGPKCTCKLSTHGSACVEYFDMRPS